MTTITANSPLEQTTFKDWPWLMDCEREGGPDWDLRATQCLRARIPEGADGDEFVRSLRSEHELSGYVALIELGLVWFVKNDTKLFVEILRNAEWTR